MGVPSIIFPVALNQSGIAEQLSRCGAAIALTDHDLTNGKFKSLMNNIFDSQDLSAISQIAAALCDGEGVEKIIGILNA